MFSFEVVCVRKKRTQKKRKEKKSIWVTKITHKKYIPKKHSLIPQSHMVITLIQKI
jgi:hypothetical protein